jgi:hypothetical protein
LRSALAGTNACQWTGSTPCRRNRPRNKGRGHRAHERLHNFIDLTNIDRPTAVKVEDTDDTIVGVTHPLLGASGTVTVASPFSVSQYTVPSLDSSLDTNDESESNLFPTIDSSVVVVPNTNINPILKTRTMRMMKLSPVCPQPLRVWWLSPTL